MIVLGNTQFFTGKRISVAFDFLRTEFGFLNSTDTRRQRSNMDCQLIALPDSKTMAWNQVRNGIIRTQLWYTQWYTRYPMSLSHACYGTSDRRRVQMDEFSWLCKLLSRKYPRNWKRNEIQSISLAFEHENACVCEWGVRKDCEHPAKVL